MCTKTATFDVDNATKSYRKILDLGPYKGLEVGYDWGAAQIKQFIKYYMSHEAHQEGFLLKSLKFSYAEVFM